ncbi:uncharacterized protein I303_101374 [Kwoniella dejecticola CBS 10117]|uniref:Mediator of RNA polymerase II transcription subunit 7 n=1 Tax=Kwoniella dejecticola CBS 10117 TaxID=1296121 RepID=A0A1A6AHK3_9TREE|nr:uncharacterized protein I303_01383 [Kwoniella dejecticola CBS 10117]OBR89555.1 hypothetical protein I303_01383 [Kwoniella dejecticola CBS 10117]
MSGHPTTEDALPITNTLFPPPPAYWQSFTDENIRRYEALAGRPPFQGSQSQSQSEHQGHEDIRVDINEDESTELAELKSRLDKPNAQWIEEDGRWMCFGNLLTTQPSIPTIESIGLPPMLQSNAQPQETLPTLLSSFLHTVLLLLDVLTTSARTPNELMHSGWAHEGDQYIQHLSNLAATMMITSNQLRQLQSESTLILIMEKEIEERKKQTQLLRSKCREIAGNIQRLKQARNPIVAQP